MLIAETADAYDLNTEVLVELAPLVRDADHLAVASDRAHPTRPTAALDQAHPTTWPPRLTGSPDRLARPGP